MSTEVPCLVREGLQMQCAFCWAYRTAVSPRFLHAVAEYKVLLVFLKWYKGNAGLGAEGITPG